MKNHLAIVGALTLTLALCAGCDPGQADATDAPPAEISDGGEVGVPDADAGVPDADSGAADTDASPDGADADAAEVGGGCPATFPGPDAACPTEGQQCGFGKECCCGQCYPSEICSCAGGIWACHATDACFIPGCPDADATSDADVAQDTDAEADSDGADADADDTPDAGDASDAGPTDTTTPDASAACDEARAALAAALYAKPQAFTAVVRLDHDTLAPLGYALIAGPYQSPDEAAARATANSATGYGDAKLLSGPSPEDAWVFYKSPGDFGGVGVVSARTGLAVFGGSIVWLGQGDITWPATWSPPSELASGCAPSGGFGATRGFDLVSEGSLDAAAVDAALAVVADTALPAAIWQGGYAFDAVVLRYPRSMGEFNPATAEWIVLLGGGWLE